MEKIKYSIWMLLCLVVLASCSEEIPDLDSEPILNVESLVTGLPGESIVLKAKIADPAGITKVAITYEPWSLAKVIDLPEGKTQYILEYSFRVPDEAEVGSSHSIEIATTNVGEKVSVSTISVQLSQDNEAPSIAIAAPANGGTFIIADGDEFNVTVSVSDGQGLSSVRVFGFGINETFSPSGNTFSFDQGVDFQLAGSFNLLVTASDLSGNTSSSEVSVNIEESLRFPKMYIADVSTEAELTSDVFGVPSVIDGALTTEKEGVEFEAFYYSKAANSEIRFIPQKESFAPFVFGSASEAGKLVLGSDETVAPIILPEVGYYRIIIDVASFTYSLEKYTPRDDTFDFVQIIGTGVNVTGESTCLNDSDGSTACWNFASGKALTVDPENPYRFSATVEFFDQPDNDGANGFIMNSSKAGWSPFWRFDPVDREVAVPNGGDNFILPESAFGTYTFEFDTHLNRVKITPQ